MQNRYAGDVGDFGKFGLLRCLVGGSNFSLGINWYLFTDEGHNQDGKYINYLNDSRYEKCDNDLHKKMAEVVSSERSVKRLESANLFNCETFFFSESNDFYSLYRGNTNANKDKRRTLRENWNKNAVKALSKSNVVFLDPDNGLEVKSCQNLNQKKSGKYAYFEEIKHHHAGKKFTVIYHHLNRHKDHGTHSQQIQNRADQLQLKINPSHKVFAIRYHPYSPRAFFIIASQEIEEYIDKALRYFLRSDWRDFWDNCYISPPTQK